MNTFNWIINEVTTNRYYSKSQGIWYWDYYRRALQFETKEDYITSNYFYRTSPVQTNDDLEDTYIDALWEFDPDSIILNRICFNGISIITSENTKDGRVQVGVNQWAYVPTLITNIKKVLEIISKTLNIEVEIHEI